MSPIKFSRDHQLWRSMILAGDVLRPMDPERYPTYRGEKGDFWRKHEAILAADDPIAMEIVGWCRENLSTAPHCICGDFCFDDDDDAMLFTLRWH